MMARFAPVDHVREPRQETLAGVNSYKRYLQVMAERLDHLFGLARAHTASIDEDAGQAVADSLVNKQRRDRRVHAAGKRADDALIANEAANLRDGRFDHRLGVQSGAQPQTRKRNLRMMALPCGVCDTSG